MKYCLTNLAAVVSLAFVATGSAYAQATRTWVSGVGDDANPCSRTAPCKTFAGAISKTAAGGEISVLDPGGFGGITITKSITINGEGTLAGVLVSGTHGVIINAASTDVIRLHNISINGLGPSLNGINFLGGNTLEVDNVTINGFTNGIEANGGSNLAIKNSSIVNMSGNGVKIGGTTGNVSALLDRVAIQKTAKGIDTVYAQSTTVASNSIISQSSVIGAHAEAGKITINNSLLASNQVAIQANSGASGFIMDSIFNNNQTVFGCGGGFLSSDWNNRVTDGNIGCSPMPSWKTY